MCHSVLETQLNVNDLNFDHQGHLVHLLITSEKGEEGVLLKQSFIYSYVAACTSINDACHASIFLYSASHRTHILKHQLHHMSTTTQLHSLKLVSVLS